MDEQAYHALARDEETGWYYLARSNIVAQLVQKYVLQSDIESQRPLEILDIGSGTGGSSMRLLPFGNVTGLEPSETARALSRQRFPNLRVVGGSTENLHELFGQSFDLVVMLCVLYHRNVSSPEAALKKIAELQHKNASLIWNEPVHSFLWRQHDRQVASGRRFSPAELEKMLERCGYEVVKNTYLLSWAFPFALLLAFLDRLKFGRDKETFSAAEGLDHKTLGGFGRLGSLVLQKLTEIEWRLSSKFLPIPFGVSRLILAKKK